MSSDPIVIVGAGLAGLCCAVRLSKEGVPVLVLDAEQEVGGRVRSDKVDGFTLDRGFQVLQTGYPEAKAILDYDALALHPFDPGATVFTRGSRANMIDPWRQPTRSIQTLFNSVGTIADRWRLGQMRQRIVSKPEPDGPDQTTIDYLRNERKFSEDFIERFLRPWISGMFFDEDLQTSSHYFQFVFRMISTADVSIPAKGMGAIPAQLAAKLPEDALRLSTQVTAAGEHRVTTHTGEQFVASKIVLAVDGVACQRLSRGRVLTRLHNPTTCCYLAADNPPPLGKLLGLNGERMGPVSNVCVHSNIAPDYAPPGAALICVSVRRGYDSRPNLTTELRDQLTQWFGKEVQNWRPLQRYDIPHAIPVQPQGSSVSPSKFKQIADDLYVCGDHCDTASINGAMHSGRATAEAILRQL